MVDDVLLNIEVAISVASRGQIKFNYCVLSQPSAVGFGGVATVDSVAAGVC